MPLVLTHIAMAHNNMHSVLQLNKLSLVPTLTHLSLSDNRICDLTILRSYAIFRYVRAQAEYPLSTPTARVLGAMLMPWAVCSARAGLCAHSLCWGTIILTVINSVKTS